MKVGVVAGFDTHELSSFTHIRQVLVPFRVGARRFVLRVKPTSFEGSTTSGPFFESVDCTGTPYVGSQPVLLLLVPVAIPTTGGAGPAVYLADPSGTVQTLTVRSQLRDWQFTPLPDDLDECEVKEEERDVIPAIEVINYADVFTPPFSVR